MRKKAYLELGITLVIGFLIGFFVNSIVTDKRIKDFSMHQGEWNFWRRALSEVQATEEQKKNIVPIIRDYTDQAKEIMHDSWEEILPLMEEMEHSIMSELTPEQQRQINVIKEKRSQMRQDNINKKRQGEYGRQQGQGQRQGPGRGDDRDRHYKNRNPEYRQGAKPVPPQPPTGSEN